MHEYLLLSRGVPEEIGLTQSVFVAELHSLLAEWQKGFCQTHSELAEPLALRAELYSRQILTPWARAHLLTSNKIPKNSLKTHQLEVAELR